MTELDKLEKYLKDNGYPYTRDDTDPDECGRFDLHQIRVFNEDYTEQTLSVICHYGSYGYEKGLLEIMGDIAGAEDHVKGWLTADDVIALLSDEEEEIEGPELGNILFGNSRGEYRVERKPIQEMWYAAFEGLLDDYGYLENKSLKAYETSRGGFENEICLINPYYWGDDDDIAQEHNFIYKPENICIDWYKYPMRDAYCNIELSPEKAEEIFKKCAESMRSMNDETI